LFATALATRIAFGTTVDADTSTARRRMDKIQLGATLVVYLEGRNTKPAGLLDTA
jgi:hypothetical protein